MASYAIITVIKNEMVSRGGTAEILVYVSGYGDIDRHKIYGKIPTSLSTDDPPGRLFDSSSDGLAMVSEIPDRGHLLMYDGGNILDAQDMGSFDLGEDYPALNSEVPSAEAAWKVEIDIGGSCDSGDYEVPFVFTYGDDSEVRQSSTSANIHVNNIYEDYQDVVEATAIIVVVLTLASLFLQAIAVL